MGSTWFNCSLHCCWGSSCLFMLQSRCYRTWTWWKWASGLAGIPNTRSQKVGASSRQVSEEGHVSPEYLPGYLESHLYVETLVCKLKVFNISLRRVFKLSSSALSRTPKLPARSLKAVMMMMMMMTKVTSASMVFTVCTLWFYRILFKT